MAVQSLPRIGARAAAKLAQPAAKVCGPFVLERNLSGVQTQRQNERRLLRDVVVQVGAWADFLEHSVATAAHHVLHRGVADELIAEPFACDRVALIQDSDKK